MAGLAPSIAAEAGCTCYLHPPKSELKISEFVEAFRQGRPMDVLNTVVQKTPKCAQAVCRQFSKRPDLLRIVTRSCLKVHAFLHVET